MEGKCVKVNTNKTKVMVSGGRCKEVQNIGRWPRGVCGTGVGRNSIQCTNLKMGAYEVYNVIKGSMFKACRGCTDEPVGTARTSVDIGDGI